MRRFKHDEILVVGWVWEWNTRVYQGKEAESVNSAFRWIVIFQLPQNGMRPGILNSLERKSNFHVLENV